MKDSSKLRRAAETRENPPFDRRIFKLIGAVLLLLWLPVIVWPQSPIL